MPTDTILGSVLGNCKILKRLGEGAQSVVYLARHQTLDKEVAVKVLAHAIVTDQNQMQRFLQEARAAARLEHPNIVQIYDAGAEGDTYYMVMQCVTGSTLDRRVKRKGRLRPKEAAELILQIADALQTAHAERIIHRDIKPGNIIVTKEGIPKLLDFGMSRDARRGFDITLPGVAVGTPMFMPPEQANGQPADARSDLFSLGAVLYYLLTGKPPFTGDTLAQVLSRVLQEEPPPEPLDRNRVPEALQGILRKLMQKDPKDRYPGAQQLIADLEEFVGAEADKVRSAARRRATGTISTHRIELSWYARWKRRSFWAWGLLAGSMWFLLGLSAQEVAWSRVQPGLLECLAIGWTTTDELQLRVLLAVLALGSTATAIVTGRGRLQRTGRPMAGTLFAAATGLGLYAWAATLEVGEEGLLARSIATIWKTGLGFPGAAGSIVLALGCLASVLLVRLWFPPSRAARLTVWGLGVAATLLGSYAGAMGVREDPGVAAVFESPQAGPWPALVCLAIAGGWLVTGLRGYWSARRPWLWVPLGIAAVLLALMFGLSGGSVDFSGASGAWSDSIWIPLRKFPLNARKEGALAALPLITGAWLAAVSLLRRAE